MRCAALLTLLLSLTACASAVAPTDASIADASVPDTSALDVPPSVEVAMVTDTPAPPPDVFDESHEWQPCATQPCPSNMVCIHEGFVNAPDTCGEPHCWYRPATDGGPLTCDQANGELCRGGCDHIAGSDVFCGCD